MAGIRSTPVATQQGNLSFLISPLIRGSPLLFGQRYSRYLSKALRSTAQTIYLRSGSCAAEMR